VIFSHRYGLEYIGCAGVTDVVGVFGQRRIPRGGEDLRSCVVAAGVLSALCRADIGVLQNVRGGSQVRSI